MTLLLNLTNFIIDVIETMGYPGLFLIMVLEGIMTPIPSEIILPFAGYLSSPASHHSFDLYLVIFVGTSGATVGSTGHSIPGTRSFISFPAGIAKMNIGNFIVYTFCGALIWTSVLSCLGFWLGERWMTIVDTVEILDAIVIVTLIISLIVYYLIYRHKNKTQSE
jgi:membrane protein DedA with SNARE-associated domain